ncbi:hypothetical protein QAD02_014829 [Eretmocerus hayati]|uniref:Uncharacterized protein n=1 Tax=Eretmocerus hayati TaxID=131215 RepID=A0ACC2P6V1_9HYME|nr:hypothetical protein QAD02_014829 [Eretmocerus hayati]
MAPNQCGPGTPEKGVPASLTSSEHTTLRQEGPTNASFQATRAEKTSLVAPFRTYMSPPYSWQYDKNPCISTSNLLAILRMDQKILRRSQQTNYVDDIILWTTGDPHGAEEDEDAREDTNQENAIAPAKQENLSDAVSTRFDDSMKYGNRTSLQNKVVGKGIKTLRPSISASVLSQLRRVNHPSFIMCQTDSARCLCLPRSGEHRWLAGAPGGWWPTRTSDSSDDDVLSYSPPATPDFRLHREPELIIVDSSDEEGPQDDDIEVIEVYSSDDEQLQAPPTKKRRVEINGSFGSSISHDAPIDLTVAETVPQPQESPHGYLQPQPLLPMLPHGPLSVPSRPQAEAMDEVMDPALDSLSTIAIASDPDLDDSSSAYSSDAAHWPPRANGGPIASPLPHTAAGSSIRRQRRSRAERAARNAAWSASIRFQSPTGEDLALSDTSDDESLDLVLNQARRDETMFFTFAEFDRLVAVFRATRDPVHGQELINYLKKVVRNARKAQSLRNWRKSKREEERLRIRQEAVHAGSLIQELEAAIDPAEPQPGPSGMPRPKKQKTSAKKSVAKPRRGKKKTIVGAEVVSQELLSPTPTTPEARELSNNVTQATSTSPRLPAFGDSAGPAIAPLSPHTTEFFSSFVMASPAASADGPSANSPARNTESNIEAILDEPVATASAQIAGDTLSNPVPESLALSSIDNSTVSPTPTELGPGPTDLVSIIHDMPEMVGSPNIVAPGTPGAKRAYVRGTITELGSTGVIGSRPEERAMATPSSAAPRLELMELDDDPCLDLEILPRTPATPLHLVNRNREVCLGDEHPFARYTAPMQFMIEMMSQDTGVRDGAETTAPIRMRIRRITTPKPAVSNDE